MEMLVIDICKSRDHLQNVSQIWIWTSVVLLLQNGQLFPSSGLFSFFPFLFYPSQMWNIEVPVFGDLAP